MLTYPITQLQHSTSFDFGNALYFPTGAYGTLPVSAQTDFGASDFSFSCWTYIPTEAADGSYRLCSKYIFFGEYIEFKIEVVTLPIGRLARLVVNGRNGGGETAFDLFTSTYFPVGSWACVIAGRKNGEYFEGTNGRYVNRGPLYPTNITLAGDWLVGGQVPMYLDSMAFFTRGLTEAECGYLYSGGRGNSPLTLAGCSAYYRFDEPAGTTQLAAPRNKFLDATSFAHHGTTYNYPPEGPDFVNHNTLQ